MFAKQFVSDQCSYELNHRLVLAAFCLLLFHLLMLYVYCSRLNILVLCDPVATAAAFSAADADANKIRMFVRESAQHSHLHCLDYCASIKRRRTGR